MNEPTTLQRQDFFGLWRDYYELCKPRVVLLMILTAIVGMHLAGSGTVPLQILILGTLGIGLTAGGAAAINHVADQHIDRQMRRTERRPIPTGRINTIPALIFAGSLAGAGLGILWFWVNPLTAWCSFLSLIGYACIYTLFLKHKTPQNIVIGGLAGAAPPLLGWVAVSNSLDPGAWLLVLIIFVWTPPHFWALAIHRLKDYKEVSVPMLPVTHGVECTRWHIFAYTILLTGVSYFPCLIKMSGIFYGVIASLLNAGFLRWAWRLLRAPKEETAIKTFRFSIVYLMWLFLAMLVDHYLVLHHWGTL